MHTLDPHACDPPAPPTPMAFLKDPPLPGTAPPLVQGAASPGTADRAAQPWVWNSRFGPVAIEVRGQDVFVNGDRVAPHVP